MEKVTIPALSVATPRERTWQTFGMRYGGYGDSGIRGFGIRRNSGVIFFFMWGDRKLRMEVVGF